MAAQGPRSVSELPDMRVSSALIGTRAVVFVSGGQLYGDFCVRPLVTLYHPYLWVTLAPMPSLRKLGEPADKLSDDGPGPKGEAGFGIAFPMVSPERHQAVCLVPLVTKS